MTLSIDYKEAVELSNDGGIGRLERYNIDMPSAVEYNGVVMSPTTKTDLLAPFEVWEVMLDNSTIKFFQPLVIKPELLPPEESGDPTYWTVDVPELDIAAVGISVEELMSCVRSDIRMIWENCVRQDDHSLTPKNRNVKRHYLAIAEEVDE